jgi:hypothetical protein
VLEQRIARVHRLGQRRSVQVVNFISQGTIEEGMLSLLGFKKALFAGVLDGGSAEVSLGGSRLSRFMEGVEKATGSMGSAQVQEPPAPEPPADAAGTAMAQDQAGDRAATGTATSHQPEDGAAAASDAWRELLDAGLKVVTHLVAAAQAPAAGGTTPAEHPLLQTDSSTGRRYLRLPVPDPDTLAKLAEAVARLLPRSTVE